MKSLIAIMLTISLVGCTNKTELGKCVGINGRENPALQYDYSALNIALGVIFLETIVVPLVVVLDDLKCPVATR